MCIFAAENQLFKKEESRPLRACGLKQEIALQKILQKASRPLRACGLKPYTRLDKAIQNCHAPCGRVD